MILGFQWLWLPSMSAMRPTLAEIGLPFASLPQGFEAQSYEKLRMDEKTGGRMQIYWGAKAIVERIGLKDHRRLPYLIKRQALPAFLRHDPKHSTRRSYYSDESLISRWLVMKANVYREELLAKEREHELS